MEGGRVQTSVLPSFVFIADSKSVKDGLLISSGQNRRMSIVNSRNNFKNSGEKSDVKDERERR
jgi:hypothetical protein